MGESSFESFVRGQQLLKLQRGFSLTNQNEQTNQNNPMPKSSTSVVPIGKKVCKPFLLEVMVFSPESGFKFKVIVERTCTPEADAIWKLVFDLYKIADGKEVQLVHVSFTAGAPVEQKAIETMADEGITEAQSDVIINDVHPAVKEVVAVPNPTPKQRKRIHGVMQKAVTAVDV